MGRNNKRSGGKAQRTAVKRLGMQYSSLATGEEAHLVGHIVVEMKSGGLVRPLATAFDKAKKQSDAARAVGNTRPFVLGAIPEPTGKRVIYAFECRSDDELTTVVAALASQLKLI